MRRSLQQKEEWGNYLALLYPPFCAAEGTQCAVCRQSAAEFFFKWVDARLIKEGVNWPAPTLQGVLSVYHTTNPSSLSSSYTGDKDLWVSDL